MTEKPETTSSNGEEPEVWGTLGELLLACAVNRHGTNSWDSIADELRKRLNHNFSPHNCKLKYVDLKNRFHFSDDQLLRVAEDLRKIRVEELKREVQRHNHSIVSLQLKVKRLKEERERSSSMAEEPDPRIEPDGTMEKADEPDSIENRSFNESNESNHKCVAVSLPQEEAIERKPKREPEEKGEITSHVELDSIRTRFMVNSNQAVRPGVRRRGSCGDELLEARANKRISVKSQPLIKFLETLRSHKHGSAFRGRLPSQETEKYQHLIRQHMDLDTVEYRLNKGIYTDCHLKFYRDLLLIFTNAVIFYRKSSAEHIAARELRKLVIDEIALRTHKPNDNETQPIKPDPNIQQLVKKPRSSSTTSTMVLCRRRSSGSSHATSNNGVVTRSKDKNGNYKFVTKERSLSGQRGLRVMNYDANINVKKKMTRKEAIDNNKKENDVGSESEVDEPMGMTLKKISVDQKEKGTITRLKKQGMANFLKRIKQNSPSKQENKKEVGKGFEDVDEEEEEDEDEDEEEGRRAKMTSNKNDNNNKGKKMRGGNVKRNNGNGSGNENGGGTKERRAMGRNLMTKRMSPKNGKTSSPDSGKGGRRSLRRDGDENSRKRPRR